MFDYYILSKLGGRESAAELALSFVARSFYYRGNGEGASPNCKLTFFSDKYSK